MIRLMRRLVDACYLVAALFLMPVMLLRAWRTGKYRQDWPQRRGWMPTLPQADRRIWIHAVSVGEVNAVRGLIDAWLRRNPQAQIVLSTTTDTGIARARELFADLVVIRYPLDFSWMVERALDRIRPNMIVLVELEVWYQFVTRAAARGIPVAVVNGRLSERSVRRFGWISPVVSRMFRALAWVGAQDQTYAERFRRMGTPADRVHISGSMKWDTAQVADQIPGAEQLAADLHLDSTSPLWVCGSTGPGEEAIILDAYRTLRARQPRLQLVIVPRKPERFDEVAELISQAGWTCHRRSQGPRLSQTGDSSNTVWLGDTMGELRKFYSLADFVFVGRSLAAMGGSDMMEVAALAKPIIVGPHNENFADAVGQLAGQSAIRVLTADTAQPQQASAQLADAVADLCDHASAARDMAQAARQVVVSNRGAIERTLSALMEILQRA